MINSLHKAPLCSHHNHMLRLEVPKQAGSIGKRNIDALSDFWVSNPSCTVCSHIINSVGHTFVVVENCTYVIGCYCYYLAPVITLLCTVYYVYVCIR